MNSKPTLSNIDQHRKPSAKVGKLNLCNSCIYLLTSRNKVFSIPAAFMNPMPSLADIASEKKQWPLIKPELIASYVLDETPTVIFRDLVAVKLDTWILDTRYWILDSITHVLQPTETKFQMLVIGIIDTDELNIHHQRKHKMSATLQNQLQRRVQRAVAG